MFKSEQKSKNLLKVIIALLIMVMPAIVTQVQGNILNYPIVAVVLLTALWRRHTTKKVYLSHSLIIVAVLLCYGIISSLWAQNREGHLNYIVLLFGFLVFATVAVDYFLVSKEENMEQRLLYMLTISGVLCAFLSIVTEIMSMAVEIENNKAISLSGQNNITGIFMLLAIWGCNQLKKNNTKKKLFSFANGLMAVVFILSKSMAAIIFAVAFSGLCLLNKSKLNVKKTVVTAISVAVTVLCAWLSVLCYNGGALLGKIMTSAFRYPFGIGGGGFISGWQMYAGEFPVNTSAVGTMALVSSASGIAGMLACILLMLWTVYIYYKKQSTVSLFTMMLTFCFMFMPVAENFAAVLLWSGMLIYNDMCADSVCKVTEKKKFAVEKKYVCAVIAVVLLLLTLHSAIRYSAQTLYKKGNYKQAAEVFKTASLINVTDAKSCYMTAVCMRKSGKFNIEEACAELDTAKKRCKNDVSVTEERARVLSESKSYESAAQQWEIAVNMAPYKNNYKIHYAKALYSVIKFSEKGSTEAKENYEKITALAAATEDLDTKKEINDIADRALKYTRSNQIILQEDAE